jgi:hypothetical protein
MQPGKAQRGVQFVHGAIGLDPQRMLGHALAVRQRGFALVAGAGIDAVQDDHQLPLTRPREQQEDAMATACAIRRQRIMPVAVLAVEFAALGKAADAGGQNDHHRKAADRQAG